MNQEATDTAPADETPEVFLDPQTAEFMAEMRQRETREPKQTKLGTPCARVWADDWIAAVDAKEAELGRRICGAHTMAGTPCTFESNHPSGRCRFHGGFNLTGAPKGNRNAVLHGLYSRRLQVCGRHCPIWEGCPCSGDDVLTVSPKERPTCPYEQAEYNAALTHGLSIVDRQTYLVPMDRDVAHTMALLKVMMGRAAAALRQQQLTQTTVITTNNYKMVSHKINPYLQAFLYISSEYRRYRKFLDTCHRNEPNVINTIKHAARVAHDTDLDPDAQAQTHFPDTPIQDRALHHIDHAIDYGYEGKKTGASTRMEKARILAPALAERYKEKVDAVRPPSREEERTAMRKRIQAELARTQENEKPP